jgi:hypothetical protein
VQFEQFDRFDDGARFACARWLSCQQSPSMWNAKGERLTPCTKLNLSLSIIAIALT